MRDVYPAGIYKNLTSDSAPHASLYRSVSGTCDWTGNQRIAGSIPVSDSCIQLKELFLSKFEGYRMN